MLEREISQSILQGLSKKDISEEDKAKEIRKHEEIQKRVKRYEAYQNKVLSSFIEKKWSKIIKIGNGSFIAKGDDLFDCVALKDGKRIGISALSKEVIDDFSNYRQYFDNLLNELIEKQYSKIYIVIDANSQAENNIRNRIEKYISEINKEAINSIYVIVGEIKDIEEKISQINIE